MTITKRKKNWQQRYANNELKALIRDLGAALLPDGKAYSIYLNLARQFNEIQDELMAGTLSFAEAKQEKSKVGKLLLSFIGDLTGAEIGQVQAVKRTEVDNPILVLTPKAEAQTYLRTFFQETDFANVTVQLQRDAPDSVDGYDLVIFDNRDLAECPKFFLLDKLTATEKAAILERIALMDILKADTTCFFIHFGAFLYWVSENREQAHAANSKFSLFARCKEMIEFIDTYRVTVPAYAG